MCILSRITMIIVVNHYEMKGTIIGKLFPILKNTQGKSLCILSRIITKENKSVWRKSPLKRLLLNTLSTMTM